MQLTAESFHPLARLFGHPMRKRGDLGGGDFRGVRAMTDQRQIISGFNRELPYLQPDFWKAWPRMPARSLARFEALARVGHAVAPWQPPAGQDKTTAEQSYQRGELERSILYCRNELQLGARMKVG